jgi:hypothetical protein
MRGNRLEEPDVDGSTVLKEIFKNVDGARTGSIWLT